MRDAAASVFSNIPRQWCLPLLPGHLEKGPGPRTGCALQHQRCCKRTCAPPGGAAIHPHWTRAETLWGYGESDTRWPLPALLGISTPHGWQATGRPRTGRYTDRASAPTTMWRGGIVDWTPLLVQLDHRSMCPYRTRNRRSCADRWNWSSKGSWPGTRGPPTVSNRGPFSTYGTSMRSATSQRSNSWNPVLT